MWVGGWCGWQPLGRGVANVEFAMEMAFLFFFSFFFLLFLFFSFFFCFLFRARIVIGGGRSRYVRLADACTEFLLVLLDLIGFYWVFDQVFIKCDWVFHGFCAVFPGFYRVLLGFT